MCCGGAGAGAGTVADNNDNASASPSSDGRTARRHPATQATTSRKRPGKRDKRQAAYDATSLHDAVIDVDERLEIDRILPYLEDDERVMVVAKQSRMFPGATLVFTPNTVFCTTRRILIRSPMMLGLRYHVEYYRHRDIKTARLVRGRFTSSLKFTVPGMGTAARSASGTNDGIIRAIPHDKAEAIYRIMQRGGDRGAEGTRGGSSSNSSDAAGSGCGCSGKNDGAGSGSTAATDGSRTGGRREIVAPAASGEGAGGATAQ